MKYRERQREKNNEGGGTGMEKLEIGCGCVLVHVCMCSPLTTGSKICRNRETKNIAVSLKFSFFFSKISKSPMRGVIFCIFLLFFAGSSATARPIAILMENVPVKGSTF